MIEIGRNNCSKSTSGLASCRSRKRSIEEAFPGDLETYFLRKDARTSQGVMLSNFDLFFVCHQKWLEFVFDLELKAVGKFDEEVNKLLQRIF